MEKALGIKLLIGAGALTLFAKKGASGNTLKPGNVVKNFPLEKQADATWYVLTANEWLNEIDPSRGVAYKNVFLLSLQKGDATTAKDKGTRWVVAGVDAYIAQNYSGHSMLLSAIDKYNLIYGIVNAMIGASAKGQEPAPLNLTDEQKSILEYCVLVVNYIQSQLEIYKSTGYSDMTYVRSEKTYNNITGDIAHTWELPYGYSGYTGTYLQMVKYISANLDVAAVRDHYPSANPGWLKFTIMQKDLLIVMMIEKLGLRDIIGDGAPGGGTSPMELNSLLDQAGGIGNVLKFVVAAAAVVVGIILAVPTGGATVGGAIAFISYLFGAFEKTKKEVE